MKFATISSKGQIIIPKEFRAKYNLKIRPIDKAFLSNLIEDISNDDNNL
jgi:hypothetical protein